MGIGIFGQSYKEPNAGGAGERVLGKGRFFKKIGLEV